MVQREDQRSKRCQEEQTANRKTAFHPTIVR